MRSWNSGKSGRVRLWQRTVMLLGQVLKRLSEQYGHPSEDAYLLHPRCCRNERF